jgi:hypothetical protein
VLLNDDALRELSKGQTPEPPPEADDAEPENAHA